MGVPNPIDVHVGKRIRLRRNMLKMSQSTLGMSLGLTFQQIQKYERGVNRIGASRLYQIAKALDLGVEFFFQDLPVSAWGDLKDNEQTSFETEQDPLQRNESLELLRAFYDIKSDKLRDHLLRTLKLLAASGGRADRISPSVNAR